uniref:Uncharacterized protein n=1 Tax=Timema shepardi TaxID=629360 RepID=A0A7R9ATV1_TIMSH|nr:unnamed protein product [Timema shepardi]
MAISCYLNVLDTLLMTSKSEENSSMVRQSSVTAPVETKCGNMYSSPATLRSAPPDKKCAPRNTRLDTETGYLGCITEEPNLPVCFMTIECQDYEYHGNFTRKVKLFPPSGPDERRSHLPQVMLAADKLEYIILQEKFVVLVRAGNLKDQLENTRQVAAIHSQLKYTHQEVELQLEFWALVHKVLLFLTGPPLMARLQPNAPACRTRNYTITKCGEEGKGGGRGTLWVPVWPHRLHIPKGGPDRKEGLPMVLSEVLIEGSLNLTGVSISSVFVGICPACSNGSQVISSLNAVFQALNSRLDELLLRDEQERGEVAIRDL